MLHIEASDSKGSRGAQGLPATTIKGDGSPVPGDNILEVHRMGDGVTIAAPSLCGLTPYWATLESEILVSTSPHALAEATRSKPNWGYIAMLLVPSIPEVLFTGLSPWDDVHAAPLMGGIHIDPQSDVTYGRRSMSDIDGENESGRKDHGDLERLRERFLTLTGQWSKDGDVSADASGGVDSTSTVALLKEVGAQARLYHASPDSKDNDDSLWAQRIANEAGFPLTRLGPLSNGSKAFDASAPYPHEARPELPLFWSDSEGYLSRVAEREASSRDHVHLTGSGGDELFSALPASSWSAVRERPLHAFGTARRYSAFHRMPLRQAVAELVDNRDLKAELIESLRSSEEEAKPRGSASGWHEPIRIPVTLSGMARRMVHVLMEEQLRVFDGEPFDHDRSRHQAIYSLLIQARIQQQINAVYQQDRVEFRSLFLDTRIASYALRLPVHDRREPGLNKASLYHALKGIAPEEIFRRPNKGDYSRSLFLSWEREKTKLVDDLAHGVLDQIGLIDIPAIRREVSMPMPDSTVLFDMQRLAAVERWLRHAI